MKNNIADVIVRIFGRSFSFYECFSLIIKESE